MTVDVKVPVLAESIPDATLLEWRRQPGERVEQDEILIELETDKVVLEVPAPAAGVLTEVLKQTGDAVLSQEVLARIDPGAVASAAAPGSGAGAVSGADAGPARAAVAAPDSGAPAFGSAASAGTGASASARAPGSGDPASASAVPANSGAGAAGRERLSPAVHRLVAEHGLDPAEVAGTGKDGRITKGDVLAYLEAAAKPAAGVAPPSPAGTAPASVSTGPIPEPVPASTAAALRPATGAPAPSAPYRPPHLPRSQAHRRPRPFLPHRRPAPAASAASRCPGCAGGSRSASSRRSTPPRS